MQVRDASEWKKKRKINNSMVYDEPYVEYIEKKYVFVIGSDREFWNLLWIIIQCVCVCVRVRDESEHTFIYMRRFRCVNTAVECVEEEKEKNETKTLLDMCLCVRAIELFGSRPLVVDERVCVCASLE